MWIYPGTDRENVFKRRKYSKKCADHYDDHRSSYRVMEIIRNDPGYCWLLCAADHTFRIFAAYLFVKQPGIFSDRNFLWNGSHYGSHLYCHGPGNGYKPCPCRRSSYIRRLFRGPVFACIHQHSACGRSDPYGYV